MLKIHNALFHNFNENRFGVDTTTYFPIKVAKNVSTLDRDVSFINQLSKRCNLKTYMHVGCYYFGYIPIFCGKKKCIDTISIPITNDITEKNLDISEVKYTKDIIKPEILYVESDNTVTIKENIPIIISYSNDIFFADNLKYIMIKWFNCSLYVSDDFYDTFTNSFSYYIKNDTFVYDNLIHLLFMVKNAGETFREVLEKNIGFADKLTILDTGSTDNTVAISKEFIKQKEGNLYEEPFINFRDSRNRLLELAGEDCVFNIMLDDTYVINGDIRKFLSLMRTDDFADSFSIFVNSDIEYSSNRVTKSERKLKYINRIHEVIEKNSNCAIPKTVCTITDMSTEYMKNRTMSRKEYDLKILLEDYDDDPGNARTMYYIAETYLYSKQYEEAIEWYDRRSKCDGFDEERYDSFYKKAVIMKYNLNKNWSECLQAFIDAYEFDRKRPESMYCIAMYYYEKKDYNIAFLYFSEAFSILLNHNQYKNCMNIKSEMIKNYIPFALISLCYNRNCDLGKVVAKYSIENNTNPHFRDRAVSWNEIYELLCQNDTYKIVNKKRYSDKDLVVFNIDGGWDSWDGQTFHDTGLGGSETFVVRYAENLVTKYRVVVFCKCVSQKEVNGVTYIPLNQYVSFINRYIVFVCFINRYSMYIPVTCKHKVPTYFIMHDIGRISDIILENEPFLKKVLCVSNWHSCDTKKIYPHIENLVETISHGIDLKMYESTYKIKRTFIYSSFPNRGLLQLLQMFVRIVKLYPDVFLNIFCEINEKFCGQDTSTMNEIINSLPNNIKNHGWVNKSVLSEYWKTSHIWLYPCTFKETACLTAYEAAASKTLVLTNDLGALSEIESRGIIIPGTIDDTWCNKAIEKISEIFDEKCDISECIQQNYKWSTSKDYSIVVSEFDKNYIEVHSNKA